MGWFIKLVGGMFKLLFWPFVLLRRMFESGNKAVDSTLGRTKCPRCRSANVMRAGGKWHCNECGRNFR